MRATSPVRAAISVLTYPLRRRGRIRARALRALIVVGVAYVAATPGAWASGEIADPCGTGAALVDSSNELESKLPWLDVCSVDVSGFSGNGPLRGVRNVFHLDGDVESGAETGAAYYAMFRTEHCTVWQDYTIYPGPEHDARTGLWVYCDFRSDACQWPESEVPNFSCGRAEELTLRDTPALSAAVSANSVTIAFDPNTLPAGSLPSGLAHDLASREEETGPVATLTDVWAQTLLHQGFRGGFSTSIGPGGDFAWGSGSVALE